eukprot:SAG31_NODE_457_length_15415_cov_4.380387_8_plen_173_part_00
MERGSAARPSRHRAFKVRQLAFASRLGPRFEWALPTATIRARLLARRRRLQMPFIGQVQMSKVYKSAWTPPAMVQRSPKMVKNNFSFIFFVAAHRPCHFGWVCRRRSVAARIHWLDCAEPDSIRHDCEQGTESHFQFGRWETHPGVGRSTAARFPRRTRHCGGSTHHCPLNI